MNRSEQESLYRASTNIRISGPPKTRHHSHGTIRPYPSSPKANHLENSFRQDDLVLSVLKSPVNHVGLEEEESVDKQKDSEDEIDGETAERVPFLQRLRGHRTPRFGEVHHKRVPTPMKRKQKNRRRQATEQSSADEDPTSGDLEADCPTSDVEDSQTPKGVPDPYYPIYLPIDQAFKTKYVFHHKKGKTFQERLYVFLEHPGGWICFIYHFTV